MAKPVPVSPSTLKDHFWKPNADLGFSRSWSSVPIIAAEIEHLMPVVPIAFRQIQSPEPLFELVGALSPLPGRNLFLRADNRWLAGYVPALIRLHPFRPVVSPERGESILCIDADSLRDTRESNTQPLFNPEGKPTEGLKRAAAMATEFSKAQRQTAHAVALLAEQGLIVPWELKIKQDDGSIRINRSFSHINGEALRKLDAPALHKLNSAGALQIAYAQLLSEQRALHFNRLIKLQDEAAARPATEDIESLFSKQDDTIKFSF